MRNAVLRTLSLLLALATASALNAREGYICNTEGRRSISLNGTWNTLVDPYLIGKEASRQVYKDIKETPALFYEYSFEGARPMQVPGDWNHQYADLDYYEGTVWYARHFDAPPGDGRLFLNFEGVSARCEVYLNGELLGSHEGAFTPFQFEITGRLRREGNFLCLAVNNERRADAIPARSFDWWNYGGITREVSLLQLPGTFIRDYFLRLKNGSRDRICLDVDVSGTESAGARIHFSVPELGLERTLVAGKDGKAAVELSAAGLRLWSPSSPKLYEVILSIDGSQERITDRIGFRDISVRGEKILLNGEEIFLKGINIHEEIPQESRRAWSEADARQLLDEAGNLGCNMVRLAHYPQSVHILREADRRGIIVWEEIPLWQGIDFADAGTYRKAQNYLREMIERDRNRCSVGLWSLSNETRPGKDRNRFLEKLLSYGKTLDGSRLFTSAFSHVQRDPESGNISMKDPFADMVDVVGINLYLGWYEPWRVMPEDIRWEVSRGKPLVFSEFGGEALAGRFGDASKADSWSEDYQAGLYSDNLKMARGIANLAGTAPWLLYDFRSPYRLHPELQNGWNRKGVVSESGRKKKSWYVLKDFYQGAPAVAEDKPLYKDASAPVEDRVEDLVRRMTFQEKAMQLVQYSLGRSTNMNNIGERLGQLPPETGSLIYHSDTPELRNLVQKRAMEESRLGIPMIFGYDVIHGFKTIFQVPLGQACSWNADLVRRICALSAREALSAGIQWYFSPMIDIARDPRWGRVVEGYGEDPYATSVFAAAAVSGYQEEGAAACLKHFVGYGASEAGRDYVYTEISDQTLWDTYLPPYEAGIKAGALSVMSSFNDLSGIPASAHPYTMQEVLRGKWGFDGIILSDWATIAQLLNQGYSATLKDAAEVSFKAGIDIDMQSLAYEHCLDSLVREGKISEEAVNESVRRILRLKFRMGLFENPYVPVLPSKECFLKKETLEAAARMAAESMVLLQNNAGVLPLEGVKKIALVGPLADNQADLLGSWAARGEASDVVTVRSALAKEFEGKATIEYAKGCEFDSAPGSAQLKQALKLVKKSDVAIVCLGEKAAWSGENASRSTIALPEGQLELLSAIRKNAKKVVVVLFNGRPLELSGISSLSDAIVEAWQPGTNGAESLAGILSGRINPSGKLAVTFPYSTGQIPIHYNRRFPARLGSQGRYQDIPSEPMYPFGFGLSYSNFRYGDLRVDGTTIKPGETLRVEVDVTNDSTRDGVETLLWFIRDPYASVTRPMKELKYFERKHIPAGQTVTFTWEIDPWRDLSFVDRKGERHLEPGNFIVFAGDKSVSLTL